MKECGRIVDLKGNIAVVKVERDAPGDCCKMDKKELVFLEARNVCGAGIGDQVYLDPGTAGTPLRRLKKLGIGIGLFFGGLILGDYAASRLGLGSGKELFSLASGLVPVVLFYLILRALAGKKAEGDLPAAYQ
jgi:hypothetical protein